MEIPLNPLTNNIVLEVGAETVSQLRVVYLAQLSTCLPLSALLGVQIANCTYALIDLPGNSGPR